MHGPNQVVTMTSSRDRVGDEDRLLAREWLVTNGLGGYASSTLLCAPTRRYHGLFVPDLPSPWGRTVMIPRLDEAVLVGTDTWRLSGVEFEDGRVDGEVSTVLQEFVRQGQTPIWRYRLAGRKLEKRVLMPYGHNTLYVEYRLLEGDPVRLQVRPFITFRMLAVSLHTAKQPPFSMTASEGRYEMHLCDGAPPLKLCLRPACGLFVSDSRLSQGVCYRVDRDRGSEHVENQSSPGYFQADLALDQSLAFVASTEPWEHLEFHPDVLFEAESQRVSKLLHAVRAAGADEIEERLALAADQFIIVPGSRVEEQALARASGDEARTVIAGYHWFTDWGRDTMISLEGLTLCTGRYQEAQSILKTFAGYVQDGLLPNLFPEGERQGLYHTADATLWYFHALDRYHRATGDGETLRELQPVLRSILHHHVQGTRFGIGVDHRDGLLRAAADGYQLTWMDAKVDGWVVTPRRGKPVEIQALWYNALRCMAEWGRLTGRPESEWTELAERVRRSFNGRFWFEASGYLCDVVDGDQGDDSAFRPNQLLAIALPHPVLDQQRWHAVVEQVADKLLTPLGLRTLSRDHPNYKAKYVGDLRARDAAYHQGTVWAWLIGPFIDAWLKVSPDPSAARSLLEGFEQHLAEGGIGTISEIFDAEPPYHPRGCIAQAWSVAEVLRAWQNTRGAPVLQR